jgi:hypothetical protein
MSEVIDLFGEPSSTGLDADGKTIYFYNRSVPGLPQHSMVDNGQTSDPENFSITFDRGKVVQHHSHEAAAVPDPKKLGN